MPTSFYVTGTVDICQTYCLWTPDENPYKKHEDVWEAWR